MYPVRGRAWRDDDGVTAMEYALIAALIAIVIVIAVTLTGNFMEDFYCLAADWLEWTSERDLSDTPEWGNSTACAN